MANNYLITGYWGEPHVTAENDRGINAAIFGPGRFVLPVGEQFRAEYIGNNTIRLYDGKLIDNGAAAGIPAGTYIDLLVPEAGQGMNRTDLVIFQYSKDPGTLVESGEFIILSGNESAGYAPDPDLTQEDLLTDEAALDQIALWRIEVSGANISAPAQLFSVMSPGMYATIQASKAKSPFNLLDNSDWTNPVNQRNASPYRGLGYSLDRWIVPDDESALTTGSGFVLIQNDSATSAAMFTQRLPKGTLKAGQTYTGAIWLEDGSVICGNGVCVDSGGVELTSTSNDVYVQIAPSSAYDNFRLNVRPGKYARVKHVALYAGAYTAETLPDYRPKGYGAELAECQRYYVHNVRQGYGYTTSTTLNAFVALPVSLRVNPSSVTVSNLGTVRGNGQNITPTEITFNARAGNGVILSVKYATGSGIGANNLGVWTGTVHLSADL